MNSRVLIIGAGVAGLSAGCYCQMNGLDTIILEQRDRSGGLCTAWQRGDYLVDGCLPLLAGSGAASRQHRIWQELGVAGSVQFLTPDQFSRVEDEHDQSFSVYADLERLREHMLSISPPDRDQTNRLCDAAARISRASLAIPDPPGLPRSLTRLRLPCSTLPAPANSTAYHGITSGQLGSRFQSPLLRLGLYRLLSPSFPATRLLTTLAWLSRGTAGYPLGGSLAVSDAIERQYRALGGHVRHSCQVIEILTVGGKAVGVRTADGSTVTADHVIAAGDGYGTLFRLLRGRYFGDRLRRLYAEHPVTPPVLLISLGVRDSFVEEAPTLAGVTFPPRNPLAVAGEPIGLLTTRIVNYDPALAPTGCSLVQLAIPSSFDFWWELRSSNGRYRAAKQEATRDVIAALDCRWRGLARRVQMIDVATPATFFRRTGNWRGSPRGWIPAPGTDRVHRTLPGLSGLYLAGHWPEPGGGVLVAAMTGRQAVQLLCRDQNRRFRTTIGSRQEPMVR